MHVQIPIAGISLTEGQTYDGQLPVWATRPLMIRVLPDSVDGTTYPTHIRVIDGGLTKKELELSYQSVTYIDLSFAAPLLTRADRNNSDGTPNFPQQVVEIWSKNESMLITLPVFHCDEIYKYTLGIDEAFPQPVKPRIPGQTLDIYFPYRIHPSDAFPVEVEPVTGAPGSAIFPTTYVLGNTIDITYIKKLTIKNVWGAGLDQVINYEDRLMSDVVYGESLQCALRARWNMRNGQWFWAAFKDYFWSNKFTPIRGRGGVTEQAEITINLEYGEEWYNVYQELLVSSNIVFELNIPGINQRQSKQFRAEVSGDTGARWSNSTKTYRQQVRFKTTELQDNYMFLLAPDQPPAPSIVFTAQKNPWTVAPACNPNIALQVYSNAAYYVESEPSWFTVINGTTLLTPDMFEQGSILFSSGSTWEQAKVGSSTNIRLKKPFTEINNDEYLIIANTPEYECVFDFLDEYGKLVTNSGWRAMNGTVISGRSPQVAIRIKRTNGAAITPADITTLNAHWGKYRRQFPAGTSYVAGVLQGNTGEARTGTLSLRSMAGAVSYPITINQQKASISLSPADVQVSNAAATSKLTTVITANTDWVIVSGYASWITPTFVSEGGTGTHDMFFNIQANTGAQRTAYITFRSKVNTSVTAILSVYQAGATGNISASPSTFNVDYLAHQVTVDVTSFGAWSVSQRDTWITPSVSTGANGTTTVTVTIADNTQGNNVRTGTITFYNDLTGNIAVVTVNQTGAPTSIGLSPFRISGSKAGGEVRPVNYLSGHSWTMVSAPSWVAVSPTSGASGHGTINVTFNTPNPGAARTGQLRIKNTVTNEIAICLITQEG